MRMPKPTVGRIVHFRMTKDVPCVPAIVTHVWENGSPDLTVFYQGSLPQPVWQVGHDEDNSSFLPSWHWPERDQEYESGWD